MCVCDWTHTWFALVVLPAKCEGLKPSQDQRIAKYFSCQECCIHVRIYLANSLLLHGTRSTSNFNLIRHARSQQTRSLKWTANQQNATEFIEKKTYKFILNDTDAREQTQRIPNEKSKSSRASKQTHRKANKNGNDDNSNNNSAERSQWMP